MYYISGKNLAKQEGQPIVGWSVVTDQGDVCVTMVGEIGLSAAMIVCEQLNNHPDKYEGPLDNQKMTMLNYDDSKIIWDTNNVAVLEALCFSTIGDMTFGDIQSNTNLLTNVIFTTLDLLVEEGWVEDYNTLSTRHNTKPIEEGGYRLSYMGRKKLEWLTGSKQKDIKSE